MREQLSYKYKIKGEKKMTLDWIIKTLKKSGINSKKIVIEALKTEGRIK